jgi:hypothetical protein
MLIAARSSQRLILLGKGICDGKDSRSRCRDELLVPARVVCSCLSTSTSARLIGVIGSFSTSDEAVFSNGATSECSALVVRPCSSVGSTRSWLKASVAAHAVAICRKARRAAWSRLSSAQWLQSADNLQQSSATDGMTYPTQTELPDRSQGAKPTKLTAAITVIPTPPLHPPRAHEPLLTSGSYSGISQCNNPLP